MAKLICPCIRCEMREPGCHGGCERYKDWKAAVDAAKAEKEKYREAHGLIVESTYKKNRKWLKKKGAWTK